MQVSAKALVEILLANKFFCHPNCALVLSEKETARAKCSILRMELLIAYRTLGCEFHEDRSQVSTTF